MAKFYARLIAIAVICCLGVFLLIMYSSSGLENADSSLEEVKHGDRLNRPLAGQGNNISGWDSYIKSGDIIKSRSNLTLITDHPNTVQQWGWPETQRTLNECAKIDYSQIKLPDLSVIICFHGKETLANLLHTVHSVYQRTPPNLLHEIILVDDFSQNDDFGAILEMYVEHVFGGKVWIHRSSEKLGLIRARLLGIQMAKGEVVSVMDSHVEVQHRWAEPLLHEIHRNPNTLAACYLDWMEKKGGKWEYRHGGTTWKSYFDWTFIFGWQAMSAPEVNSRTSLTEPIRTPVIIGTIFAIRKEFFLSVGGFDEGMQLWGGENLDLPVRVWLCGGQVVNVPCSRAGHLEKPGSRDYRVSPEWVSSKNNNYKRFAEVWAGDYKKYFYMYTPDAENADEGDISDRLRLRSVCTKPFSWLLNEVFPELGVPDRDSLAWGHLTNEGSLQCLDTKQTMLPGLGICGGSFAQQGIYWSKHLHLRFPIHILNYKDMSEYDPSKTGMLFMDEFTSHYKAHRGSKWFHWKGGPIIEIYRNLCMEASDPKSLRFSRCDQSNAYQRWYFQHYNEEYDDLMTKGYIAETQNTNLTNFMSNYKRKWRTARPLLKPFARKIVENQNMGRKSQDVLVKR